MTSYLAKFKDTFIKPYIDGSKQLYKDIREIIKIRKKLQLSRREWRLKVHTKKNLAKAVPVLIFFFLPIVGYVVPVVCYMFPFVLPPIFMTPDQKVGNRK